MLDLAKPYRRTTPLIALAIAALASCGDDGGAVDASGIDAPLSSDLRIEQTPTMVEVDTELVFTIVVSNLGPDAVIDAGVTTLLPPGIAVVSATCTAQGGAVCGGTSTAGGASWSGLDLPVAANNSNTVTLRVLAVPTRLGPGTVVADLVVPDNVTDPDPSPASNQATRSIDRRVAQLSPAGGRVDWFGGAGTSSGAARPIAFDRVPPNAPTTTEVYIANPDTGMPACITCGMTFPRGQGFVGNPTWHPNGEYLVVQVENASSQHTVYSMPDWGLDSDLWMIKADATWAARIWSSQTRGVHHGVLHPQFSPDGALLVFGERVATSTHGPATMWPGTNGQDPWRGWGLRVARLDNAVLGLPKFSDADAPMIVESVRLAPSEAAVEASGTPGNGRYEPAAITNAGVISYAFTPPPSTGRTNNQYIDAAFTCTLDSVTELATATCGGATLVAGADRETWDDLAQRSADGARRSFPSSRADASWRAQANNSIETTLRTELYVMPSAGVETAATAITSMNATRDTANRYAVGDHRWSSDGTRIVFEVAPTAITTGLPRNPEVWIVAVP